MGGSISGEELSGIEISGLLVGGRLSNELSSISVFSEVVEEGNFS